MYTCVYIYNNYYDSQGKPTNCSDPYIAQYPNPRSTEISAETAFLCRAGFMALKYLCRVYGRARTRRPKYIIYGHRDPEGKCIGTVTIRQGFWSRL